MAQGLRRSFGRGASRARAALALGLLVGAALPAAAQAFEPDGAYYVLVHYQDSTSANPETWRWEDRVWVFERSGSRLVWIDYPIVLFRDESTRFRNLGTSMASRVTGAWEPDAAALRDIKGGLATNSRGSKRKRLRGSDADGWESRGAIRAASAMAVGYQEIWRLEGLPDRPVFSRSDQLDSAAVGGASGRTEYRTTGVEADGTLVGRYERDGTRSGRFRLMPSGPRKSLARDPQRQQKLFASSMLANQLRSNRTWKTNVRTRINRELAPLGVHLPEDDMEALIEQAARLTTAGESPAEVERHLTASVRDRFFGFAPHDPTHDDGVRYALPSRAAVPPEPAKSGGLAGFDFALAEGETVLAARAGEVVRVVDGFGVGNLMEESRGRENRVLVLHADGTFGVYVHLQGADVREKDRVESGQPLGRSGASGYTEKPKLHFGVWRVTSEGVPESLPIEFGAGD
ncbi:MAG: M23 family metallopeptidase [Proteobacteria bacterium]|nr:M23 family metallopeptidase [Pseudomonadota bacterium]